MTADGRGQRRSEPEPGRARRPGRAAAGLPHAKPCNCRSTRWAGSPSRSSSATSSSRSARAGGGLRSVNPAAAVSNGGGATSGAMSSNSSASGSATSDDTASSDASTPSASSSDPDPPARPPPHPPARPTSAASSTTAANTTTTPGTSASGTTGGGSTTRRRRQHGRRRDEQRRRHDRRRRHERRRRRRAALRRSAAWRTSAPRASGVLGSTTLGRGPGRPAARHRPPPRRGPRRAGRPELQPVLHLRRHPSVGLAVYQLPGTNALDVANRVQSQNGGVEAALSRRRGLRHRLRHHAVHPRIDRGRRAHAAGGRGAGRPRRAALPAGLAGHDPADDRRARCPSSAPSPSWRRWASA